MSCPNCGNKQPLRLQRNVFYPYLTREEAYERNYAGSQCQLCGHKWDKNRSSKPTTKTWQPDLEEYTDEPQSDS